MLALELSQILLANIIVLAAAAIQTSIGIGFGLVAVPLLALIDVRLVPGPTLFVSVFLALTMTTTGFRAIDRNELAKILVGVLLGTCAGAYLLTQVPPSGLADLFGILILIAVAITAIGFKFAINNRTLIGTGTAAGLMGTMSGIHGPPLALVYQHQDPEKMRAMIAAIFVVGYVIALVALHFADLFGAWHAKAGLILLPGLIIGYFGAVLTRGRYPASWIRIAILVISALSAISLILFG